MSTTANQRARILDLLKEQGSATNLELNRIAYRYSARIFELRGDGHRITTIPRGDRVFTYRYEGRGLA